VRFSKRLWPFQRGKFPWNQPPFLCRIYYYGQPDFGGIVLPLPLYWVAAWWRRRRIQYLEWKLLQLPLSTK